MTIGCLNHGCKLNQDRHGQRTNGGCTCLYPLTTENRIYVEKQLLRLQKLEAGVKKFCDMVQDCADNENFDEFDFKCINHAAELTNILRG